MGAIDNNQIYSRMSEGKNAPPMQGTNDFASKLLYMLEDPESRNVVRWSDSGDSFVVLDPAEFTKSVLPRHFKHSNFASFVRQLNKYDFHKIRTNQGDPAPYGENSWEFKHPDFHINNRHQLDSIKRKTPSSKRGPKEADSALSEAYEDLQKNYRSLESRLTSLEHEHHQAMESIQTLQAAAASRDEYIHELIQAVKTLMAERGGQAFQPMPQQRTPSQPQQQPQPPQPQQQQQQRSSAQIKSEELAQSQSQHHAHPMGSGDDMFVDVPPPAPRDAAPYSVLLVDDDEVSVRICRKLLSQYGCDVDVANNGVDAVSRAQASTYDTILMGVIIPALDGLSATELIRNFNQTTPIVAMTTADNIDNEKYTSRGISGILTKPFTKDQLYSVLDNHLKHRTNGQYGY